MELVNIGISHFLTKPLNYDAFVHILYTKLKENNENSLPISEDSKKIIDIDENLYWNKELKQIFLEEKSQKLTKKEIKLLDLLLKYREKTHTIEEILAYLWAEEENVSPDISNLKNVISRLRKKIPNLDIENVYGFGYRLNIK